MEYEFLAVVKYRVAGVIATLKADDDIRLAGQGIHNFSLTFVAPLRPDND
jgi:hypothetical protein